MFSTLFNVQAEKINDIIRNKNKFFMNKNYYKYLQ